MTFGTFIKEIRTKRNLSLREVASRLGIAASYLSRVESGKVGPSEHLIAQLAPILECSMNDLAIMAGNLPPQVRSALDRCGSEPADVLRELAAIYSGTSAVEQQINNNDIEIVPGSKRRGRPPKKKPASADPKTLALFPDEISHQLENSLQENKIENNNDLDSEPTTSTERRIDPRNKLNALTSTEWTPETVSVWTQKGIGAGHPDAQIERQHPAPFSFTDVARLIRFFSKPGDCILDPFAGVGSTLKACAIEGRCGIGIELNSRYVDLTKERLKKEVIANSDEQKILEGDSRAVLGTISDDSVDFVVTSPPYWNILHKEDHKAKQERKNHDLDTRYSNDSRDLGNIKDYYIFLDELTSILGKCGRILKQKKYMAVVVSDFRDKSKFIMFHADLAKSLETYKFGLRGIKVLYQRHKKIFPYGYPYAYVPNIHHQYILILQNER